MTAAFVNYLHGTERANALAAKEGVEATTFAPRAVAAGGVVASAQANDEEENEEDNNEDAPGGDDVEQPAGAGAGADEVQLEEEEEDEKADDFNGLEFLRLVKEMEANGTATSNHLLARALVGLSERFKFVLRKGTGWN